MNNLKWGLVAAAIVILTLFIAVNEIKPSDKVPAHTGGYYSDKYVSF